MTEIYNDNVQVKLEIDGLQWLLIEAKVELSQVETPDYVDLRLIPHPDTKTQIPDSANIGELVGSRFTLDVDTQLISNRDTDAEEVTRLFTGRLANISPTGEKDYEAIAYNPVHQPFNSDYESTSIMNQEIKIAEPSVGRDLFWRGPGDQGITADNPPEPPYGTQYPSSYQIKASKVLERILLNEMGLPESRVNINLSEDGTQLDGPHGSYVGGVDRNLFFEEYNPKISEILEKALRRTKSEWWFDRFGDFYFGVPDPSRHELDFIVDADAGKTTPPYQSVKVIGGAAASQENWSRAQMNIDQEVVVTARIGVTASDDGEQSFEPIYGDAAGDSDVLIEPVFTYRNAEISTVSQAKDVATKLIEKIAKQQADGKITVTGFPEIRPFDGLVMPQASDPNGTNYHPNKPMGGATYQAYKVVHHLNNSDGFQTEVHVSLPVGATRTVVDTTNAPGGSGGDISNI